MKNRLNKLLYDAHSGLGVAEHQGDIARYTPNLLKIEFLISKIKEDPSILDNFDPHGIENGYKEDGMVFCEYEERWRSSDFNECTCPACLDSDEYDNESEEE